MRNFKINYQGLIAMGLVIIMFGSIFFIKNINWPFLIISVLLYAIAIVSITVIRERLQTQQFVGQTPSLATQMFRADRAIICSHGAFVLLIMGLWIASYQLQGNNGIIAGLFLACVAGGALVPYLLIREPIQTV